MSYHFTDTDHDFRVDMASAISKKEADESGLDLAKLRQLQLWD